MLLLVELASAPRRTGLRVARRDALDLSRLRGKREKTLPDDKCDMQNHAWTSGLFASLCQLAEYTAHRAASIQPPACLHHVSSQSTDAIHCDDYTDVGRLTDRL